MQGVSVLTEADFFSADVDGLISFLAVIWTSTFEE